MAQMVTHDIWNFGNVQTTKTHFYLRLFLNPNGIKTQIKKTHLMFEAPRFACTLNFKTFGSEGMDFAKCGGGRTVPKR